MKIRATRKGITLDYKEQTCWMCNGARHYPYRPTLYADPLEMECDECGSTGILPVNCQICGEPLYNDEGAICLSCLKDNYLEKIRLKLQRAGRRWLAVMDIAGPNSKSEIENKYWKWVGRWEALLDKVVGA